MLYTKPSTPHERRLTKIYRGLDATDRRALLAFAEFLANGGGDRHRPADTPADVAQPEPLPRPEQETVIGAIRRLSVSYGMLDRGAMLHETSALMSAHVLQGRKASAVIDDLEALFERHYARYRDGIEGRGRGKEADTETRG